jgi:hypothetical protein
MATRMQQRRGTAEQWTAANPVLAAGEIGFETDTSKFKMGNGSSAWSALQYFANAAELASIIDGAPGLLNTLDELAAAIGDDPAFFTTTTNNLALKAPLASPALTGTPTAPTAAGTTNTTQIATTEFVQTKINNLVGGAPGLLDTLDELAAALSDNENFASEIATSLGAKASLVNLSDHNNTTINVHGIADTSVLVTDSILAEAITDSIDIHNDLTTNVHGIPDTSVLVTDSDLSGAVSIVSGDLGTHVAETTSVHGIADTSLLVTISDLEDALDTATVDQSTLAGTGIDWNSVNNRFDIDATIATTAYADQAEADAITAATSAAATEADSKIATAVGALTKSSVGLANVDNTSDANKPVSTATQTALDLKANLADPTFTGTVSGVTKTHVGLGNLDNTADADKPVSSATQTALNLKANLANPTFTGTVTSTGALVVEGNLTVSGTTTTVNAADLSITDPLIYLASNQYTEDLLDVGFMAATGAPGGTQESHLHSGFFRDASDSKKWKLVSNVPHPVNNVVDITNATRETLVVGALEATSIAATSATIGDVSNTELQYLNGVTSAVQTQIDAKSPINAPTFTGLVTVAASGVAFTDGTQTKEGTPSRTPIVQKSANYTLSTLTHRDSLIEVSAAGIITVPTDATLNYPIGTSIDILQTGTGEVKVDPVSVAVTINATPGRTLRTQWSSATLFKRAANTWVLFGDLK